MICIYTVTCKREWDILAMLKLQNITALPEVLTIQQVHRISEVHGDIRLFRLQTTMVYLHLTETEETNTRKVIEKLFRRKK